MKNIWNSLFGKSKHKSAQAYLLDEHTKPDLLIVNGFTYGMGDFGAQKGLYQELVDTFNIKHVVITTFNFSSHHADTNPKEVLRKMNDEYYDKMVQSRVSDIHYVDGAFKRSFHAEMTSDGLQLSATQHTRKSAMAFEQNRTGL